MSTEPAKPLTAEEVNECSLSNTRRIENLQERIGKEGDFVARYKLTERLDQAQSEARLLATIAEREREIAALNATIEEVRKVCSEYSSGPPERWHEEGKPRIAAMCEAVSLSRAEKALKAAQSKGFDAVIAWPGGRYEFSNERPKFGDVVAASMLIASMALDIINEGLAAGATFSELGEWE